MRKKNNSRKRKARNGSRERLSDIERNEHRENVLHPSPYLGYDYDRLGVHMMEIEAFNVAENQFRRAIWLNPFESQFKVHLAWCLYRLKRYTEARKCMDEIPKASLTDETQNMKRMIEGLK